MALAREGVNVTITARGAEALEATAAEIRAATGARVITVAGDLTTEAGRAAALAANWCMATMRRVASDGGGGGGNAG